MSSRADAGSGGRRRHESRAEQIIRTFVRIQEVYSRVIAITRPGQLLGFLRLRRGFCRCSIGLRQPLDCVMQVAVGGKLQRKPAGLLHVHATDSRIAIDSPTKRRRRTLHLERQRIAVSPSTVFGKYGKHQRLPVESVETKERPHRDLGPAGEFGCQSGRPRLHLFRNQRQFGS